MNGEILIPLGFFAMVVAIVYLALKQKERMAMIHRGMDPSLSNIDNSSVHQLRLGLIFIGIALGFLLGDVFSSLHWLEEWVAYVSMVSIFTGIAFVLGYYLTKNENRLNKNED
ncbi:MAG: hypothetical protein STSR0006_08660 [Lentimicrobium sp.]